MPQQPDDLTIGPVTTAPPRGGAPTSPRFVPGAIVAGRYRLVALLGRGGMGDVYRADDLTLDHPVALKFLPEGVAHDGARLAQFHNELRIARQVSHKNVCRLYDLGEADGRQFLTMEYVDGEDLASLLRRIGRVPPDKAIEIARQLCAGLAAAHERGVLHRDLKPANVMLDGNGNVRIADFGLAIAEGAGDAALAGTPQYMAPEQLVRQPASVKSDIYALGLVLFEIFTGSRAHDAKTLHELQQWHQHGMVPTGTSIGVLLLCAAAGLARRNLRIGRGDRRGASRVSMFVLVTSMLAWVLGGRHVPDPSAEVAQFFVHLGSALVNAGLLWLLYVALEPYVRRYCSDIMISWTRVLSGQIRDARVGRDVLIGVAAGILVLLLSFSVPLLASLLGRPLPPRGANLQYLLGARFALAAQLRAVPNALQNAMLVALVFVVGSAISGRRSIGAATAIALFGVLVLGEFGDSLLVGILFALCFTGALVSTMMYFGLLAHVVAFFVNLSIINGVLTADMSKMYAPTSAWLMLVITGLAAFGFYASRAGQPMLGNLLLRD